MQAILPLTKELVLIGGGHSHALVLRMWGMNPLPGVRVTVINPAPTAPYTGMLPGFVAGHYSRDELDIDLVRLARFAGARLLIDRAVDLDTKAKRVVLESGRRIPYDTASLDIGITSDLPEIPGFTEYATPAKPLGDFADRWHAFLNDTSRNSTNSNVVIIGGGVGGVELSLAMEHALSQRNGIAGQFTLIDRSNILKGMGNLAKSTLIDVLKKHGISILEHTQISRISDRELQVSDGPGLNADFIVGAAGARPQDWLQKTGLTLVKGFVAVDAQLRSLNAPDVFAVGDCAHMTDNPRPKAGVFAVRQSPVLFSNLRAVLSGNKLCNFKPQKDYLKLISLGGKSAVADKWGLALRGPTMWRLKNQIDQKFMRQFTELSPMKLPDLPKEHALGVPQALGDKPLCGGCGAKVGGGTLSDVLAQVDTPTRQDIISSPGDDAAILNGPENTKQVLTTDHLRSFTQDPYLMAKIAAVHALGDIWAMGAEPQSALATIVLPRLSTTLQGEWLAEIMSGANEVFTAEGAAIVGGHTSIGDELTIGFTVTGLTRSKPITIAGARPGDILILTKPIGTGTVLAGEMALKAKGGWVVDTLNSMSRAHGHIAPYLRNAHAMTDVTGFGLAGHLANIARASDVGVEIDLGNVPFLPGAVRLAEDGVRSSIFESNRQLAPEISNLGDPKVALLFDPQTAGGLLAAVDPKQVDGLLLNIRNLGVKAYVIGRVVNPPAILTVNA